MLFQHLLLALLPALAVAFDGDVYLDKDEERRLLFTGPPRLGLWKQKIAKAQKQAEAAAAEAAAQAAIEGHGTITNFVEAETWEAPANDSRPTRAPGTKGKYGPFCFPQLKTHFDNNTHDTFCQRFWISAEYYKPGGAAIILDGGEGNAASLSQAPAYGPLKYFLNATDGLGIVLEHRYYGSSVPVPDFSTDNLRWLNNEEALEDSAYFIKNFIPPAEILNLTDYSTLRPATTPWIYYGGSYPGARAAHMRALYPDLVWAAYSSSGVVHATIDLPGYYQTMAEYGEPKCVATLQKAINDTDALLDNNATNKAVKTLYGLGELNRNDDFASALQLPFGYWQGGGYRPQDGYFAEFCKNLTKPANLVPLNVTLDNGVQVSFSAEVNSFASYTKQALASECDSKDISDCFSTESEDEYHAHALSDTWRLWQWQVCNQWGFFQVAPLTGPRVISKYWNRDVFTRLCSLSYPPGEFYSIPALPDVDTTNKLGDWYIQTDRIIWINGEEDPWRSATVASDDAPIKRTSTDANPYEVIPQAAHCYDFFFSNSLAGEKEPVRSEHAMAVAALGRFYQEFHAQKSSA